MTDKMNKFCILTASLLLTGNMAQAQLGQRINNAVRNAAENAVVRQAERRTDAAVNQAIDDAFDQNNRNNNENGNNNNSNSGNTQPTNNNQSVGGNTGNSNKPAEVETAPANGVNAVEMAYAKSDFVPGDEIIFEDYMEGEKLGEFPSQWDLHRGNAEIASINGKKVILMDGKDSWLEPLMKTPKNYLGDIFTLEFDYFQAKSGDMSGNWELDFMGPDDERDHDVFTVTWYNDIYDTKDIRYGWTNSSGRSDGNTTVKPKQGEWYHIAVSFNKRALKVYFNGERIANIPNVAYPPGWVTFWTGYGETNKNIYIKDVRIAKGAVPLYDRMMNDGKIISYGITFDVGKSTLKPESMGEINRIVELLKENTELKFSVEGHTDNTGNAALNQTLSDARSKAVVDKLVEMGISADRLRSAGKGQTSPISDNSTDEGRAKNRRVEFVKI